MQITQTQKNKKFSISGITEDELIEMWHNLSACPLKEKIYMALFESLDEDTIHEEYGYGKKEYLENLGVTNL